MSTVELRKRLIESIQKTQDPRILEEVFRLLALETTEDVELYKLNEAQNSAVHEAREQIQKGQFLTDEQANKEMDEWLRK